MVLFSFLIKTYSCILICSSILCNLRTMLRTMMLNPLAIHIMDTCKVHYPMGNFLADPRYQFLPSVHNELRNLFLSLTILLIHWTRYHTTPANLMVMYLKPEQVILVEILDKILHIRENKI